MYISLARAFLGGLLLFVSLGYAETIVQEKNEKNIVVDSVPLSDKKRALMQHLRNIELEQEISAFERFSSSNPKIFCEKKHKIISCEDTASFPLVTIEDGSEWAIDPIDRDTVSQWEEENNIIITPKSIFHWGSNYQYTLTNIDKNSSIKANMRSGPTPLGKKTTWITAIDADSNSVILGDVGNVRTVWEISWVDQYLFKKWQQNHVVIIGENDSCLWWLSDYNKILINAHMNHYIRAKKIGTIVKNRLELP